MKTKMKSFSFKKISAGLSAGCLLLAVTRFILALLNLRFREQLPVKKRKAQGTDRFGIVGLKLTHPRPMQILFGRKFATAAG